MKRDNHKPKKELNLEDWEEWSENNDNDFDQSEGINDEDFSDLSTNPSSGESGSRNTDPEENEVSEYRDALDDRDHKKFNWNYIFLIIVVVLLALVIFKIVQWNKGTASDYDPNHIDTSFDSEVLDVIFPLLPSALEGHEDDGVQTILCLGNDTFADDRDSEDALTSLMADCIAESTNQEISIINGAFAGTTVSNADQFITDDTLSDMFNMYWIVTSLCEQDFTYQHNALTKVEGDSHYAETVEALESLDMSTVDTLVLFYDGSDYQIGRHVTDPSYEMNTSTYVGAMSSTLKLFQETYPYIRIIILSPTYMQFVDENGDLQNGDTYNIGNGSMPNYLLNLIDVAQQYTVTILDNYYGSITEDNYKKYLEDGIHLNKKGREVIAKRLAEVLK